jgi:hypothetical protein
VCERIQKRRCFDASSGNRGRGDVSNDVCNKKDINVYGNGTLEMIEDISDLSVSDNWTEMPLTGSIYGNPPNSTQHDYLFNANNINECNKQFPVTSDGYLYKRMECECQAHAKDAATLAGNTDPNSSDIYGILDYVHIHDDDGQQRFDEKCFVKK